MAKISVVTVCYNAELEIEKTMYSVLQQSYVDFEYIIIDGNSKDNTISIINNVIKKYPNREVKFVSEHDNGIYDAMNKGINMAKGEWLNFMNAGDAFCDINVLERISNHLSKENDVVYGDYTIDKRNKKMVVKSDPNAISKPWKLEMGFNHQASFVRTDFARKYNFDLRFKLAADYNMMMTLYEQGAHFHYVNVPIVKYDLTGASNQNIWQHRFECLSVVNPNHSYMNRALASLHYARMKLQSSIAKNIYTYFPKLLNMYYSKKNSLEDIQ